jgi:thymidylate synthase
MMTRRNITIRRDMKINELDDVWLELFYPSQNLCTLKSRDMDVDYLAGEIAWHESGSLKVKDIEKFSTFWTHLADSNGTVNSNYGFIVNIEKWAGISQFEWCINSLKKDLYTRQALINYNMPRYKYDGVKDFVCTISQQFIVRDGALDSIVLMRSNDLIYGLTYDIVFFTGLQMKIAKILDVPLGKYLHYDTSLHVYERHFEMLKQMANEKV